MVPSSRMPNHLLIAGGAAALLLLLVGTLLPVALLWSWLVVLTAITFFYFRWDKGRAGNPNAWRVPERLLLGMIWVGGVAGGAAGMYMQPRHKTQKLAFKASLLGAALTWTLILILWYRR